MLAYCRQTPTYTPIVETISKVTKESKNRYDGFNCSERYVRSDDVDRLDSEGASLKATANWDVCQRKWTLAKAIR